MTNFNEIFLNHNITQFSIIDFSKVKLIECRKIIDIPKNAKSVIACLFPYYYKDFNKANVSKYAISTDYHIVADTILSKICIELSEVYNGKFVWFADNSPIAEVDMAVKANLGVRGKNNLLINEQYGSYVFIGEIVTDVDLSNISSYYVKDSINNTICINCSACFDICPNSAINELKVDYTKCLSRITQNKKPLSDNEIELIKENKSVWGCDRCQDICPMNKDKSTTNIPYFKENIVDTLTLNNLEKSMLNHSYCYIGKKTLIRNINILTNKNI